MILEAHGRHNLTVRAPRNEMNYGCQCPAFPMESSSFSIQNVSQPPKIMVLQRWMKSMMKTGFQSRLDILGLQLGPSRSSQQWFRWLASKSSKSMTVTVGIPNKRTQLQQRGLKKFSIALISVAGCRNISWCNLEATIQRRVNTKSTGKTVPNVRARG